MLSARLKQVPLGLWVVVVLLLRLITVCTLCQQQSKTRTFCKNGPIWCSSKVLPWRRYYHSLRTAKKWYPLSAHSFLYYIFSHCKSIKSQISSCFTTRARVYDKWLWPSFDALLLVFSLAKMAHSWSVGRAAAFSLLTTEVEKIIIIMQKKHQGFTKKNPFAVLATSNCILVSITIPFWVCLELKTIYLYSYNILLCLRKELPGDCQHQHWELCIEKSIVF